MIFTMVSVVSPAKTRSTVRRSKLNLTLSSSSSTVSCVAAKLNVFDVSVALKLTLAGTPE